MSDHLDSRTIPDPYPIPNLQSIGLLTYSDFIPFYVRGLPDIATTNVSNLDSRYCNLLLSYKLMECLVIFVFKMVWYVCKPVCCPDDTIWCIHVHSV